jgi:hypothetical protein
MRIAAVVVVLLSFSIWSVSAQTPDGKWIGIARGTRGSSPMTITFEKGGTGSVEMGSGNRVDKSQIRDVVIRDRNISFSSGVPASTLNVRGVIASTKMMGSIDILSNGTLITTIGFCVSKDNALPCIEADIPVVTPGDPPALQVGDPSFDASVAEPAYKVKGPKVLFDEGHRNRHTTKDTYKPFADLLRNDGYEIITNLSPFSPEILRGHQVLVIANARGNPGESAFTDAEIAAVRKWVSEGGSLFLIADHAPAGAFAAKLSAAFGVEMSTGTTTDINNIDPTLKNLLFSSDNKLLADHPVTRGRNAGERVTRIVSFTGQSLKSLDGTPILKLSDTAVDKFPNTDKPDVSAKGRAQAVALEIGKGRVFVSGEAAMHSSQSFANGATIGLRSEGIHNRQFVLNVMHWLSRLI